MIAALVALLLGGALTWLGGDAVASELSLRAQKAVIDARVVDARILSGGQGRSYEVRYRFQVPGSAEVYDHRDGTGRSDLWASLRDEDAWLEAQARGLLPVTYLPKDPSVNRPVDAGAAPLGDSIAGLVLGLLVALLALATLVVQARGSHIDRSAGTARSDHARWR